MARATTIPCDNEEAPQLLELRGFRIDGLARGANAYV